MFKRLRLQFQRRKLRKWIFPGDAENFALKVAAQRKLGTTIGRGVRLLGQVDGINPHLVTIGDYCVIGVGSALLAHCPIRGGLPVTIGSFVYIAYAALVLPGVTVGDDCVIGAGAVVTKDVLAGHVVAGNPARVLRKLQNSEKQSIRQTLINNQLFGTVQRE